MAGFFDGPHATPKPSDQGPVYLGIKNITEDGHLDLSQTRRIAWDDFPRWTRRVRPEPGDVVFTYEASLHRYAIIPEGFEGCLGRRTALIRPDRSKVDSRFLLYQLLSPQWRAAITRRLNIGATVDRIPLVDFPTFHIQLPPLRVQTQIVAILAAYDELVENNLRRIQVLEEMAQSVYQEWFIGFRFPGHEQVAMADSPIGRIPDAWAVCRLAEVADVNSESIRPRSAPEEIQYIDISSVSPGSVDSTSVMPLRDAPSRARRIVRNGDTIWSTVRPNRRSHALILDPPANTIASTGFAVLRPTAVPWSFLYLATSTREFSTYLANHARGAAYPAVNAEDFERALVLVPPDTLLQDFAGLVDPMLWLREVLRRQNEWLSASRDQLLPRLVSGAIDLSGLEVDTGWLVS